MSRPPRIASWLVDLFASGERGDAILGDLLEEFSDLASRSGAASARRWYWRQSVETIAQLVAAGFRSAPWSILGIALGGYLLLAVGDSLPERLILAMADLERHHVTPYYTWQQAQDYLFWLNSVIWTGRLAVSLLAGAMVAAAAKGREMVATMALFAVCGAMSGAGFLAFGGGHWERYAYLLPALLLQAAGLLAIVTGGVAVREARSILSRRPSGA